MQPIPRDDWASFFRSLSNRHIGDRTRMLVGPPTDGSQENGDLVLLDYDPREDRVTVKLDSAGSPVTRELDRPSWVVATVTFEAHGSDSLRINGHEDPERLEIVFGS